MKRKIATGWVCLLGVPALAIELPQSTPSVPPPPPAAPAGDKVEEAAPAPRQEEERVELPAAEPEKRSAYFGVGCSQVPGLLARHLRLDEREGVVIRTLDPDGPAAKAGLAEDDVITRVSGRVVGDQEELRKAVLSHQPGEEVEVEFIHRGEAKSARIALGEDQRNGPAVGGGRPQPLDSLMLEGLPQDQAQRIREAVERNLKAIENMDRLGFPDDDPAFDVAREMQEQMGRLFQGRRGAGTGGSGFSFQSSSTIKMMDDRGSVEIRSENGEKKVRAYDRDGNLQWEGALDDKDGMPEEVRERVGRLNIDMDYKGNGLRLHMRQR